MLSSLVSTKLFPPITSSRLIASEKNQKLDSGSSSIYGTSRNPDKDLSKENRSGSATNDNYLVPPTKPLGPPLKILFLSSDTGGGHRASAESLGAQFQKLYPGSTYHLLDIIKENSLPPYNDLESWYQHLSSHPKQWNMVYKVSNFPTLQNMFYMQMQMTTPEHSVRKKIQSFDADVVISVHPLMNHVPVTSCAKISAETGRHLPMFTVVTDLGSGHCTWFDSRVEKMFIASEEIQKLAMKRGRVPEKKLTRSGLPIREDFSIQAKRLGKQGRMSEEGKKYRTKIQQKLGVSLRKEKVILVMGGGEGVGSLSSIVNSLYIQFRWSAIPVVILVVCGRNAKLKESLGNRDWDHVYQSSPKVTLQRRRQHEQIQTIICHSLRNMVLMRKKGHNDKSSSTRNKNSCSVEDASGNTSSSTIDDASLSSTDDISDEEDENPTPIVKPLGFITNMAEYMVAADILISKAGPGTIAEAASVGLPVLLTSFLPGQEEGNVDFVIQNEFGTYKKDSKPQNVAMEACDWIEDEKRMEEMSEKAFAAGVPDAAESIAKQIGTSVIRWKDVHDHDEEIDNDYVHRTKGQGGEEKIKQ